MAAAAVAAVLAAATGCKDRPAKGHSAPPRPYQTHPGASPLSAELMGELDSAVKARGPDYQPRTRHTRDDGRARYVNRLILETSPYLIQHAHNPVNWYPWGEEALAAARELGRPILLSIGYSTCHWCHVMEEESFEDEEIARYLNENYIAIKIDRERRPELDAQFMKAVNLLTGQGGWPLTVWLTPEGRPFYGGTYFPPRAGARGARIGFLEVLERAAGAYRDHPGRVIDEARRITADMRRVSSISKGSKMPDAALIAKAVSSYRERYDDVRGGLASRRSKFPSSLPIRLLLRHARRSGDSEARRMAIHSLDAMRAGGIYDQVGGGFHRYATDPGWQVPHFEKMLYDNALLAVAYLEAHQVTGAQRFAATARDVLHYVSREMLSKEGGFYSASDADSPGPDGEKEEGAYFVWTREQLDAALGDDAELAAAYFAVTEDGNFEGHSVLTAVHTVDDFARERKLDPEVVRATLARVRTRLLEVRSARPAPAVDRKVLAAWNGLMISAFARAARALPAERQRYLRIARRAADFVLAEMRSSSGRLHRSYLNGHASVAATLEDYAFVIAGLIDVFEASGEPRYLREAIALDRVLSTHFEDRAGGGFFRTADDAEKLLIRDKPIHDGAIPSGNSVQILNLLRLHELTTEASYRERADRALMAFSKELETEPTASSEMLLAVDFRTDAAVQIVVVSTGGTVEPELREVLATSFVPNAVLARVRGKPTAELAELVPLVAHKVAMKGADTAYVCVQQHCELPTSDPGVLERQLASFKPTKTPRSDPKGRDAPAGSRRSPAPRHPSR